MICRMERAKTNFCSMIFFSAGIFRNLIAYKIRAQMDRAKKTYLITMV